MRLRLQEGDMPLLPQEPVVVKEEQENPRESWGQGASKQMYSKWQRGDTHSGESGQSSTHPAPDQETPGEWETYPQTGAAGGLWPVG